MIVEDRLQTAGSIKQKKSKKNNAEKAKLNGCNYYCCCCHTGKNGKAIEKKRQREKQAEQEQNVKHWNRKNGYDSFMAFFGMDNLCD